MKRILTLTLYILISLTSQSQVIFDAACQGKLSRLDSLLSDASDINMQNREGHTLLHMAIFCNQEEIAKFLLKNKADVNIADKSQATPLYHFVSRGDNNNILNLLLTHGADPNKNNIFGESPLQMATINGYLSNIKELVKAKADVNVRNNRGNTALDIALREELIEIAEFLKEEGATMTDSKTIDFTGQYIDQNKPGLNSKIFAPNFISTENPILNAIFHPNGKEFYFTIETPRYNRGTIMITKLVGEKWSKPVPASIPGNYREFDAFITSDGAKLFYCTDRPVNRNDSAESHTDIWMMEREGEEWGEPNHIGNDVSTDGYDVFPSVSNQGTLYFSTNGDIKYSVFKSGKYQNPILSNVGRKGSDPLIASDESYLIFSSGGEDSFGESDLYISFRNNDGSWGKVKNMGERINSASYELAPALSPDGKYFFFSSGREGVLDIFWVDAKVIENLR